MRIMKSIATLAIGASAGVAFTLSCGDDTRRVDAAVDTAPMCDCAAAEPPIMPRITEKKTDLVIPAHTPQMGHGVACPGIVPSVVLNGGCIANVNDGVVLTASYPDAGGWVCIFSNPSNVDVTITSVVHCLTNPQ